jgi:acetyl-CoA carboxylase biotin carboxylase subunit
LPTARCASGRRPATDSYLRIANVVAAAETTGCEAVHPGYGFLAENAAFVRACEGSDLVFIGPTAAVVEQMGDKVQAKDAMRAAGVPLVPGSDGAVGLSELRKVATEAGLPVLLKASAGGGGKGMRLVSSPDDLEDAFGAASAEAEAAFGDGSVYVEKLVSPARHVEIQVLCDSVGNVLTLGERECSIQRRHQKLVEESPSAALDEATREAMESTGRERLLGDRLPKRGHLRVPRRSRRRLLLHRGQLQAPGRASGLGARHGDRRRPPADSDRRGRLARERRAGGAVRPRHRDPDQRRGSGARLPPAPGTVTRFVPPLGPGVRVDTAVSSGSEIPPYYDSMIAKVIVADDTRDAAISRAERALRELVVEGIPTTRDLALDVLGSAAFRSGDYSTSTLKELEGSLPSLVSA